MPTADSRAWLRLLCLLSIAVYEIFGQQQAAASGFPAVADFSTICSFLFLGQPAQTAGTSAIRQAVIDCSGSSLVPLRIAPVLSQFQSFFTGVQATVDASMASASDPNSTTAPYTALVAINGTSLAIVDSLFENLNVPQDTLLILANSSALMQNVSFISNQAAVWPALGALNMEQLSVYSSSFISNTGSYGSFRVSAGAGSGPDNGNVIVDSCHFEGNSVMVNGGALTTSAPFNVINNCTFLSNQGSINGTGTGAALKIFSEYASTTVIGSTFLLNTGRNGPGLFAGVLPGDFVGDSNSSNFLWIIDTIMENNVASNGTFGGAVYAGLGLDYIVMNRSSLVNNNARNGGSVYTYGHQNISIIGCDFNSSTADFGGGAFSIYDNETLTQPAAVKILIDSSRFFANSAALGGAGFISPTYHNITIRGSTFSENMAVHLTASADTAGNATDDAAGDAVGGLGAGLAIIPADITRGNSTMLLQQTTFTNNMALGGGGGIIADGLQAVQVQACSFINNQALSLNGGALFLQAICLRPPDIGTLDTAYEANQNFCHASLTDSVFTGNYAQLNAAADIQLDGFIFYAINSTFTKNHAVVGASGLSMGSVTSNPAGSVLLMSNMLFRQNNVSSVDPSSEDESQDAVAGVLASGALCVAVINSTFDQNIGFSPFNSYGAMKVSQLSGSGVCQNIAANKTQPLFPAQHPALFDPFDSGANSSSSFDMRDTILSNNTGGLGGGLDFQGGGGDSIVISKAIFVNNTSAQNGGGLHCFQSPAMYVTDSIFIDQQAYLDGGAICSFETNTYLYNSTIRGSFASRSGGAVSISSAGLLAFNTSFVNNTAVAFGGGVLSCTACTAALFNESSFIDNASQDVGGAIRVDPDTMVVSMQNVEARGNKAVSGAVLHMLGKTSTSTTGTPSFGLGILYISNSTFHDNVANESYSYGYNSSAHTSSTTYGTLQGGGGAVNFIGAIMWVQHSSFHNNTAGSLGGAIMFQQSCRPVNQPYHMEVGNSSLGHLLQNGDSSALQLVYYVWDQSCSTLTLVNATFSNNQATGAGGALYLTDPQGFYNFCPDGDQPDWATHAITDDTFPDLPPLGLSQNLPWAPTTCSSWKASNNSSPGYGNVIAYPPSRLQAMCHEKSTEQQSSRYSCSEDPETGGLDIINFWSTNAVEESTAAPLSHVLVDVLVLDVMNNTVSIDYPSSTSMQVQAAQAQTEAATQSILSGQYATVVNSSNSGTDNNASFTGLLLHAEPGPHSISFTAINHAEVLSTFVQVTVRGCMLGEVNGTSNSTCNRCIAGQFSFEPVQNATCDICPDNANCTATSEMVSELGYWHSGPQSVLMHACPNKDACQGDRTRMQQCWTAASVEGPLPGSLKQGLTADPASCGLRPERVDAAAQQRRWANATATDKYLDWQCSRGYQDRLCTVCQDGYGASGRYKCSKCSSKSVAIVEYSLMLLGVLLLNLYLISQLSTATLRDFTLVQGSDYLSALQLYLQLMSILATLNVEWPPVMSHLFTACGYVTNLTPQVVPLDCLIHATGLPIHVSRTIVQILVPPIMMALLMLFFCLYYHARGDPSDPNWLRRHIKITAFSVSAFFYPSLSQAALNIFSCFPIDSSAPDHLYYNGLLQATWEHGYWVLDMSTRCFHGWHLTFSLTVGVLSVLCFCIGIPLACLLVLCHKVYVNHDDLGSVELVMDVGFLYRSYNYEAGQWWEGPAFQFKMTVLLLIVIIGRPLGTYIQSLILLAMLATELVHECSTALIRFRQVRQLQICTIAVLFVSLMVSLFTADFQFTASPRGLQALAVLTIISNLVLCLVFLFFIVYSYKATAADWVIWGRRSLTKSFSRTQSFKQFVASPVVSISRRQSSGEPMLPSGVTSSSSSVSIEMSRAPSGHAPANLHRSSSVLTSQEIAAIWSGNNTNRSPGN